MSRVIVQFEDKKDQDHRLVREHIDKEYGVNWKPWNPTEGQYPTIYFRTFVGRFNTNQGSKIPDHLGNTDVYLVLLNRTQVDHSGCSLYKPAINSGTKSGHIHLCVTERDDAAIVHSCTANINNLKQLKTLLDSYRILAPEDEIGMDIPNEETTSTSPGRRDSYDKIKEETTSNVQLRTKKAKGTSTATQTTEDISSYTNVQYIEKGNFPGFIHYLEDRYNIALTKWHPSRQDEPLFYIRSFAGIPKKSTTNNIVKTHGGHNVFCIYMNMTVPDHPQCSTHISSLDEVNCVAEVHLCYMDAAGQIDLFKCDTTAKGLAVLDSVCNTLCGKTSGICNLNFKHQFYKNRSPKEHFKKDLNDQRKDNDEDKENLRTDLDKQRSTEEDMKMMENLRRKLADLEKNYERLTNENKDLRSEMARISKPTDINKLEKDIEPQSEVQHASESQEIGKETPEQKKRKKSKKDEDAVKQQGQRDFNPGQREIKKDWMQERLLHNPLGHNSGPSRRYERKDRISSVNDYWPTMYRWPRFYVI